MKEVYEAYGPKGLEILAFPCNNFGSQEPGTNEEIKKFAEERGATYPLFAKLECDNGNITHPLYKYLKESLPNGILGGGLKWNFAKFLCDKDGIPVQRYLPVTSPKAIIPDIEKLLEQKD